MRENLKDIEYGRAGKYSLRLDLHIPDGTGPFAAAILVHGGAWVAGDRINSVQPLFQPLSDAGFAWFSISYRLAGDVVRNPIGAALQLGTAENDVRRAVAFVKQHASEYRVNPNKIVLIGESAGGQLACHGRSSTRSGRGRTRRRGVLHAERFSKPGAHIRHDSRQCPGCSEGNPVR